MVMVVQAPMPRYPAEHRSLLCSYIYGKGAQEYGVGRGFEILNTNLHWALWSYGQQTHMGNPTFERFIRFSQVHPGMSHQKLIISSLRFLLRLGSQD